MKQRIRQALRRPRRRVKHVGHTPVPMPAGWYPVPDQPWERFHDGIGWTHRCRRTDRY